jgi:hypothetical protein
LEGRDGVAAWMLLPTSGRITSRCLPLAGLSGWHCYRGGRSGRRGCAGRRPESANVGPADQREQHQAQSKDRQQRERVAGGEVHGPTKR